jgi:hypothetical protein
MLVYDVLERVFSLHYFVYPTCIWIFFLEWHPLNSLKFFALTLPAAVLMEQWTHRRTTVPCKTEIYLILAVFNGRIITLFYCRCYHWRFWQEIDKKLVQHLPHLLIS